MIRKYLYIGQAVAEMSDEPDSIRRVAHEIYVCIGAFLGFHRGGFHVWLQMLPHRGPNNGFRFFLMPIATLFVGQMEAWPNTPFLKYYPTARCAASATFPGERSNFSRVVTY